tara:strand:+ start:290 stop:646 length:357 start_codon:yes stop_codon:yes gene_type:complete
MILKDHIHKSLKVITNIILMMTSKFNTKLVVKKLTDDNYKPDKRHKDLFEGLAKIRQQNRKEKFQEWLNSCNEDGINIREILNKMIQEIKTVLTNDGYVIKDEKAFRDYLASYIYKEC